MAGGEAVLREHGIEVTPHVLRNQADALNRPFFHFVRTGLPYVIAKAAVSLDGRLATTSGQSQWISGEASRRHAHRLRAAADAIIVGAGTLRQDNPSLTVRYARRRGSPPLRAVVCSRVPVFSAAYQLADGSAPSRLYVAQPDERAGAWRAAGVEVVEAASLQAMLRQLAGEGRLAVLLEGGGRLLAACFTSKLVHELVLYQAPILIGGEKACGLWQGKGIDVLARAPRLVDIQRLRLGDDQLIRGRLVYPE